MKGLPICFSEVQVKNDVTDNNNKHFVTAFEGPGMQKYHRAARAFKALLSYHIIVSIVQVNLDMTDSMGPGKMVRHMQNPSYTYDEYLICIGPGPSISSVICKNPSYSGPSYPSSPV